MSRHLGLSITEQQRFRWVETMLKSADEAGFPIDPEFRSALWHQLSGLDWECETENLEGTNCFYSTFWI
jgi:truncated hemoglobin YjbI